MKMNMVICRDDSSDDDNDDDDDSGSRGGHVNDENIKRQIVRLQKNRERKTQSLFLCLFVLFLNVLINNKAISRMGRKTDV